LYDHRAVLVGELDAAPARGESAGLDGWLLNNLFGRR